MASASPLYQRSTRASETWMDAQIASLTPEQRELYESSPFMRGIVHTTLELERDGMLHPSAERRALYGEDPEREIADIEAGTHPLLAR